MGAGLALFDMDGDGDLDLVRGPRRGPCGGGRGSARRTACSETTGRRASRTAPPRRVSGTPATAWGCATGDYDGDGDVDLFVTNVGPDVLYENQGDGRFRDVTAEAGVAGGGWSTSAAFLDADADGDLDLFVVHYVHWSADRERPCHAPWGERIYCSPNNFAAPAPDVLFENLGDGTFRDASAAAGLGATHGNGLGVAWGDLTGDGIVDVYVANDGTPNQLWRGLPDSETGRASGRFEDVALGSGCAVSGSGVAEAGMGVTAEDTDQDGDLDLFLTHLENETNTWYRAGDGVFSDRTPAAGLARPSLPWTGFGTGFCDFDHDGLRDLVIVNGRVTARAPAPGDERGPEVLRYVEPVSLLRGADGGRFEVLETSGALSPRRSFVARAVAFGDLDGDGDVDLCISENGGRLHVLTNVVARGGGVLLDLREPSGAPALGARVRIETSAGVRYGHAQSAYGYLTANDPRVHFALAPGETVERATVTWSDGVAETFGSLSGPHVTLRRGAQRTGPAQPATR